MKKLTALFAGFFALMTAFSVNGNPDRRSYSSAELALANVEALTAGEEDPNGWFWHKIWIDCQLVGTIVITSTGGGFTAGTKIANDTPDILAQVQAAQITYLLIPAQNRKKSYCANGWNPLCTEDECQ